MTSFNLIVLAGQVLFAGAWIWAAPRDSFDADLVLASVAIIVFCLNLLLTKRRYTTRIRVAHGTVGPLVFIVYAIVRHIASFGLDVPYWRDQLRITLPLDLLAVSQAFWPSWLGIAVAEAVSRIAARRRPVPAET